MTRLKYIGPDPAVTGEVPLPEGWSAVDHEEPDADLAAAKLAHRVKLGTTEKGETVLGDHTFRKWTKADDPQPPAAEVGAEG